MPRAYHIQPEEFDLLLGDTDIMIGRGPEQAELHAQRVLEYAKRSGNRDLVIIAHADLAYIYMALDRGELIAHHSSVAAGMIAGQPESAGAVVYKWRQAQLSMFFGRYQEALAQSTEALAMARRKGMRRMESCALTIRASTALTVGDLVDGLEAALRIQQIEAEVEPGAPMHGAGYYLAGKIFERCRMYDRALQSFDRAEEMLVRANDPLSYAVMQFSRGSVHAYRSEWGEAHRRYDIAQAILEGLNYPTVLLGLYSYRAYAFEHEGRYSEAREYLEKAWNVMPESSRLKPAMELLQQFASLEEIEGNFERAVEHLRLALAHHQESGNRWAESIVLEQLVRCLRALGDIEGVNKILERKIALYGELGVRIAPASVLLLIGRDEEAEREREIQHLRLQREMLEREMRKRMHELSTIALSLRQRDELIATIERRIRDEIGKGSGDVDMLRELHAMVAEGSGESWADFTRRVDDTHSEFVRALAARNPTLTPTELKVCCLLRVNLSTKEIARLLSLNAKSVELYRSRIRRKLEIDSAIHLPSALLAM